MKRGILVIIVILLVFGLYFANSLLLGDVTGFVINEIDNLEVRNNENIENKDNREDDSSGRGGNLITGQVINVNNLDNNENFPVNDSEELRSTATSAEVKVSVEVVG